MVMSRKTTSITEAKRSRPTTAEFIARARSVHGDKYDYSRVVYTRSADPVEVICPEHGAFFPRANNHISRKSGCPHCKGCALTTLETFLEKARQVHGNKYDYSRVVYQGVQKKIEIICPEHGPFWQIPMSHQQGRGCIPCGVIKCSSANTMSRDRFLQRARQKHGEKFDYSRAVYVNSQTMITIICPEHGAFQQRPHDHITRYGCAACSGLLPMNKAEFLRRSRIVHGDRYTYGQFTCRKGKIKITCLKHGVFLQTAREHTEGHGCPSCASESTASQHETTIADWITSLGFEVIRNTRNVIGGLEIDIYIPGRRLGIEFNGAFWHTDMRMPHPRLHERKANQAEQAGIRLITIWDYDWIKREGFVRNMLQHALGLGDGQRRNARDCTIIKVETQSANDFYAEHHIQGAASSALISFALSLDGELTACMSFSRGDGRHGRDADEWELVRFATRGIVRGAASRLFKAFTMANSPSVVWSFSDRQFFSGGLYQALGFVMDKKIPADYQPYSPAPFGEAVAQVGMAAETHSGPTGRTGH